MTVNFQDETFRPTFSRGTAGAVIALCAISAVAVLLSGRTVDRVQIIPWLVFVAAMSWAMYWRPCVEVSAGEVKVVNVTRTYDIPWPAIEGIDTRWALTLETTYGRVRSWAAPAPGRQLLRRIDRGDLTIPGYRVGDVARPSDLSGTESGAAALIVRQRWQALREDGFLDDARLEFERMPVTWHWDVVIGLPLLLAVAVATVFV